MIVKFTFSPFCILCLFLICISGTGAFAQEALDGQETHISQETPAAEEVSNEVNTRVAQESQPLSELSYDARLGDYKYPFNVRYFPVSSQGKNLEMAYMYLEGDGSKPVVTLMHGKNFTSAYWKETARFLNKQGYGVLMPDQIGFGKSSKPIDYQYSFAALASHTRALLESLNIKKSVIVGHSMGGMLATRFGLMFPEQTLKVVLINPIGLENYLLYVEYKDIEFFYKREIEQNAERILYYQQKNYYDNQWSEKAELAARPLIGMVQGMDKQQIALVSALTYDMIFTQPVIDELWRINVPISLVIGTRDRTAPGSLWQRKDVVHHLGQYERLGDSAQARQPFLSLFKIEGLGHLPHIEDFKRFAPVFEEALAILGEPGKRKTYPVEEAPSGS